MDFIKLMFLQAGTFKRTPFKLDLGVTFHLITLLQHKIAQRKKSKGLYIFIPTYVVV